MPGRRAGIDMGLNVSGFQIVYCWRRIVSQRHVLYEEPYDEKLSAAAAAAEVLDMMLNGTCFVLKFRRTFRFAGSLVSPEVWFHSEVVFGSEVSLFVRKFLFVRRFRFAGGFVSLGGFRLDSFRRKSCSQVSFGCVFGQLEL